MYTYRRVSLLVWLYFTEGVVRPGATAPGPMAGHDRGRCAWCCLPPVQRTSACAAQCPAQEPTTTTLFEPQALPPQAALLENLHDANLIETCAWPAMPMSSPKVTSSAGAGLVATRVRPRPVRLPLAAGGGCCGLRLRRSWRSSCRRAATLDCRGRDPRRFGPPAAQPSPHECRARPGCKDNLTLTRRLAGIPKRAGCRRKAGLLFPLLSLAANPAAPSAATWVPTPAAPRWCATATRATCAWA